MPIRADGCERAPNSGWLGVAEPEELGGVGVGFAGLAIVLEEAGRTLSPLPILSSVVMGQGLLSRTGDTCLRDELLPALLDGSKTATVVPGFEHDLTAVTGHDGAWLISGTVDRVLDGDSADVVFVPVETGAGRALFVVDTAASGVRRTVPESMDLTRSFARISFSDSNARMVACVDSIDDVLADLRISTTVAVACEQIGAAQRVLEMGVDHVSTRVQFGRPIGSFQAIKHRCAELVIEVDKARSAASHAAWALHGTSPELALAAPLAGVVCVQTLKTCAAENIQLHGGIGFTWEHPAHLIFPSSGQ